MGAPYAIKSNVSFEFYMSNALDRDGVLSSSTLQSFHPSHPRNVSAQEYRELGEREFIALYRKRSLKLVLESPFTVARKMVARLRNSLIWLQPLSDLSFVSPRVDERDQRTLIQERLLRSSAYYQYWLVPDWKVETFRKKLDELDLHDRRRALRSWTHARRVVRKRTRFSTRPALGVRLRGPSHSGDSRRSSAGGLGLSVLSRTLTPLPHLLVAVSVDQSLFSISDGGTRNPGMVGLVGLSEGDPGG